MDRVVRRDVLFAVGALLTLPFVAKAQQLGNVRQIGYVVLNDAESGKHLLAALRQGLRERGWIDSKNIVIEDRYADGVVDRLGALVAEVIRLKVDVIVTTSSATTWAAKDATKSIPIVMTASADALGEGLVTSLAHPSGNITGMTFLVGPEIAGKQLQLLRDLAPAA
jgi:putative ABC transport system substrate-binding protein